jgi:hypothetical protein
MTDKPEHLLKMDEGDIALVINQDKGWFKKVSIAFAENPNIDPTTVDLNWLGLYRACTHLSLIADTYLRTRQGIIQENGEDILKEGWYDASSDYGITDPEEVKDVLLSMGYPVPAELEEDLEEIEKAEKAIKGNVIDFPLNLIN